MEYKMQQQNSNQVLFANYDMVQAEIRWIKTLEAYDPSKNTTIDLFNNYFGAGSMGAIVFQTIRESKALAYSTFAVLQAPAKKEDPFSFTAYVGSQADKLNDAIAGMNELLNDLPKRDGSFSDAQKSMVKDIETERIAQENIIFTYLADKKKGIDYDLRKDIYAQLKTLTFEDIKKLHTDALVNKPFTYCIVASDKKIKMEDLKKYGEVKKLTLDQLFGY